MELDWSIHDSDRDADGFIILHRRENQTVPQPAFSVQQEEVEETKEIVFHHGYVAIRGYHMGDNKPFEKALSIWDKICFTYHFIGGYYVEEDHELRVNRGIDFHFLQRHFPNYPCRVQNDAIKSRSIDIDLLTPPKSDFQKAALAFMASQGTYESKHRYTQQLIDADTGDGKSTPDDTMVPTPIGLRRLDSLSVGDKVFNVDGKPVEILKVFPQKKLLDTYTVTFSDMRTARCSPDHLWTVSDMNGNEVTVPLIDLYKKIGKTRETYYVPVPKAVEYEARLVKIPPYQYGLELGKGMYPFIHRPYKYNSKDVRWEVLRGIVDKCGHIRSDNSLVLNMPHYDTLCDDTVELIRSLGYKATLIAGTIHKRYLIMINCSNKDKEKFFRKNLMQRIKARAIASYVDMDASDINRLRIISITRDRKKTKQRCILINDPWHVYLTENFVPTHNTYCGTAITAFFKKPTVIIVPLNKLLKQWEESFTRFTTLPADKIMLVQGSKQCLKILDGKCSDKAVYIFMADTIASFQKQYGNEKTSEMLAATGAYTKIIDEVHRDMKTVTMIEALSNFHMNYYMSASPDRSEQKESWMFKTLFRNVPRFGSSFKTKDEKHLNIMIKKYQWLPDSFQIRAMVNPKTGLNTKAYERELITSSKGQRQSFDDAIRVMMEWSKKIVKPENKIMILAQSVDTLYYLQKLVEETYPGETAVYYGGLKPKEKQAALQARIIIATSSSLGTGADIAGLQHVYNVSTYANKIDAIQISGRCRKLPDGTPVVYCEFVNTGYYKTMRQYERRKPYLIDRTRSGKLVVVS